MCFVFRIQNPVAFIMFSVWKVVSYMICCFLYWHAYPFLLHKIFCQISYVKIYNVFVLIYHILAVICLKKDLHKHTHSHKKLRQKTKTITITKLCGSEKGGILHVDSENLPLTLSLRQWSLNNTHVQWGK